MSKPTILVIDDETNLLRFFEYNIRGLGYDVVVGASGADFQRMIGEREYATILLDLMLPDASGLDLLEQARKIHPELPVIMITAYGTIDRAVQAIKLGAYEFLPKPIDLDKLNTIIRNAVEQYLLRREVRTLRRQLEPPREFQSMVGTSPAMLEIYNMIETVAATTATVMVTGESGTGKELVARGLHNLSSRAGREFVAINCAAIPRDLLENELFGHEKGSFTGATERYKGCFERADKGTLFLDEICEMDLGLQAKLLRLIQEQQFYRVGGTEPVQVDVRILTATNQNPAEAVRAGRFREDLYYRLNVVPINLPPLRERREDIGQIANKYLLEFSKAYGRRFQGFDLEALAALERYGWPGNVRELRNVVEQLVVLNEGERVTASMLPARILEARPAPVEPGQAAPAGGERATLTSESIRPFWQVERDQIQSALDLCGGNVQEVARRLEISPATLYRKIEKYGLVK
ncbi:MAG TPA: sigma-54 dependent transcriptional regulator [Candidatus Sumerlaeota bacterium]|nr:MAG: Regulatory protein LuxO [candidate division BRC1 bacterium ADurb.BinA292]HOE95036.1 sigma-54 dependent transcriptional regulator [Candidatus Sumerlaeota bacterium]HPK00861.1 sigma-54 dependent transcriptional regulator [Candidatus Sumerlaeota bacterium]